RAIESGLRHTCALRNAKPSLVCWGSNSGEDGTINGKLGPAAGVMPFSAHPVEVEPGGIILDVGMGYEATFAVSVDGRTDGWGSNARGQLGIGNTSPIVLNPKPVTMYDDLQQLQPLPKVSHIVRSDGSDECAWILDLTLKSRYLCWGSGDHGELG